MKSALCPYCFNRLKGGVASFRCINPNGAACKPEVDAKLHAYETEGVKQSNAPAPPVPQKRTFTVEVSMFRSAPRTAACSCGFATWKRICPECHNTLPSEFDNLKKVTLGLIGAKETGKSNYIGVLIERLSNEVSTRFGGSLNALDDQTSTRYRDDFQKYIFKDRVCIPGTVSSRALFKGRYPLNYSFNLRRGRFSLGPKAVSLSLFDTAGEDLDDEETISTHVRYVTNADGLIFFLDPLQLKGVRGSVPASVPLPKTATNPKEIIDRSIRRLRNIYSQGKIPVPVAVVFSKIDAVRMLVEPDSPLHRASDHDGQYDEPDGEVLHESIRSYLARWGGVEIDNTMATHFARFRYFGVSSFGYPPANLQLTKGVSPFRVEDPFLWLLAETGFIDKKKAGGMR